LRPGADDNTSGVSAVLELARRFARHAARRSILFVNFDAEELGLVGSRGLLVDPPVPNPAIVFMLNLDMVGRLHNDRLFISSADLERYAPAILDSEARAVPIRAEFTSPDGRTDDASFGQEGIAAVGLSTGLHADYHKASDIPARINVEGLGRIVDLVEAA